MTLLRQLWCYLASGALLALSGLINVSWAEASEQNRRSTESQLSIGSLRQSGFLDGTLVSDEAMPVRHANGNALSEARTWVNLSIVPTLWSEDIHIGAFVENRAWINRSSSAVRALAFVNNKLQGTSNAAFPFQVESERERRWGASVSYRPQWSVDAGGFTWRPGGAVRIFSIDEYRATAADGVVTDTTIGAVGVTAGIDAYNNGKTTTFVKPLLSRGAGFDVGFGVVGRHPAGHFAAVSVKGIGPPVRLGSILRTQTQISTSNVSFDKSGYIEFAPVVQGRHSVAATRVTQRPEWLAGGGVQLAANYKMLLEGRYQYPVSEAALGLEMALAGGNRMTMRIHAGQDLPYSASVACSTQWGSLYFRANALSPSAARVWALGASVTF